MSKIEVNKIGPQCGTTLTVGCGAGQTVAVDANTVTIGRCGGTVALASGASQTGFGREGSVNWQTGSLKTTTFTAVSGEGYFINQGSAITMNLPAGSAGAIVAVSDYARNFATYNLTISPNGSEKIGGEAQDAKLNVDGQAATFVYVDSTKGWINVQNAEDTETGQNPYVAASGGTETTSPCGDFKIHTFTGPGSFVVSSAGLASGSNTAEYIVIGGGGSGGRGYYGGGGGAGGFRFASPTLAPATYPAKPLAGPAALSVPVTSYPIVVGAGGAAQSSSSQNPGSLSTFSSITSAGGGAGGNRSSPSTNQSGLDGGSGGGQSNTPASAGSGNTPPVSPPQGNNGGTYYGGGGGGASAVGSSDDGGGTPYGAGGGAGAGFPNAFGTSGQNCGSFYYFSGGGGGGGEGSPAPTYAGGIGGGGLGGLCGGCGSGQAGTANTGGGGGGGGGNASLAGAGGSGIVIIRYKFQN
jgi:hypothetical protein